MCKTQTSIPTLLPQRYVFQMITNKKIFQYGAWAVKGPPWGDGGIDYAPLIDGNGKIYRVGGRGDHSILKPPIQFDGVGAPPTLVA